MLTDKTIIMLVYMRSKTMGTSTVLCILVFISCALAQEEIRYRIEEERPEGVILGNVIEGAGLDDIYSSDILQSLQFKFLDTPRVAFSIDSHSGIMKSIGRIDRESICRTEAVCEVKVDVVVQPVKYFQIIKITVDIIDINDNWPSFPEPELAHDLLESALIGSSFVIPTATDADSPQLGIQSYSLVTNTKKFELRVSKKVDGSTELRMVLKESLDREKEQSYLLQVVAYDGDSPPKSGHLQVTVSITDTNDNSPIFENGTYEVTILENIELHTTFLQVHASDADVGTNGDVVYGFSSQTESSYGNLFGIDNLTGDIFVKGHIDHEEGVIYHLVIIARDQGINPLSSDATVVVKVRDLNDNAPQISVNTLVESRTDRAEIREDAELGTFVAHITVVDADSGRNGRFNCTLSDSHFKLKQDYDTEYQVVTSAFLDREERSAYSLTLMCRDWGRESRLGIKHLRVIINDVNDQSPVFTKRIYSVEMLENNYVGRTVARVNATDKDYGKNSDIIYSLPKKISGNFYIDPKLGTIRANRSFDRELTKQLRFHVFAKDQGTPPRSSSAIVEVTILDVNDEKPQFSSPGYSYAVLENEPAGTTVCKLTATDKDSPPNNEFIYAFINSDPVTNAFLIDSQSGLITTKEVLDREIKGSYVLNAVARDTHKPRMTSTTKVTVFVEDRNDNVPIIDYPTENNNTIYLSNKIPVGHIITRVRAHDMDLQNNGRITYRFAKGNKRDTFSIDPNKGTILIDVDLSLISHEEFGLTVQVKDGGQPQRSAIATLHIIVNETITFLPAQSSRMLLAGHNFTIVVVLGCLSGAVIVILLISIAVVISRRQDDDRKEHKYNCRMEALRMLTARGEGMSEEEKDISQCSPCRDYEKPRKEVSFSLDADEIDMDSDNGRPHWETNETVSSNLCENNMQLASHPTTLHNSRAQCLPPPPPPGSHRPWVLSQREIEVHQLLGMLGKEQDAASDHSQEGSITDSGRGPSEEGEGNNRSLTQDGHAHHGHPGMRSHHVPSKSNFPIRQLPGSPTKPRTPVISAPPSFMSRDCPIGGKPRPSSSARVAPMDKLGYHRQQQQHPPYRDNNNDNQANGSHNNSPLRESPTESDLFLSKSVVV